MTHSPYQKQLIANSCAALRYDQTNHRGVAIFAKGVSAFAPVEDVRFDEPEPEPEALRPLEVVEFMLGAAIMLMLWVVFGLGVAIWISAPSHAAGSRQSPIGTGLDVGYVTFLQSICVHGDCPEGFPARVHKAH